MALVTIKLVISGTTYKFRAMQSDLAIIQGIKNAGYSDEVTLGLIKQVAL